MSKKKKQCEYVRDHDNGRCTHDTEPHSKYCKWHDELDGKPLHGIDARGMNLDEAYLRRASLFGANLQGATLIGANLHQSNLTDANLQEAVLRGARLEEANLTSANLQGADLSGANLFGATLDKANLRNGDLSNANLQGVFSVGADLQGACLDDANFEGATLFRVDLGGAHLWRANFQEATLVDTNFQGADLLDASLRDLIFRGCRLKDSTLKYAQTVAVMEKDRAFRDVADDHRILKNYFREEGYYDEVSDHYYKERWFTTKALREEKKWGSWLWDKAQELLCGYGERPWRTFAASIVLIFGLSVFFFIEGFSKLSFSARPLFHEYLKSLTEVWIESLRSSFLSFAMLGYGVSAPGSGLLQFLSAFEALLGTFMMALLAFTFGRKMAR